MKKILLIQIREDPWMANVDKQSYVQSFGRQANVYAINCFFKKIKLSDFNGYDAVIIGGSKYGVNDNFPGAAVLRRFIKKAVEEKIPLLGICFGAQLIADVFGGKVVSDYKNQEFGTYIIKQVSSNRLWKNVPKKFLAQCAHHDKIIKLPIESVILASSQKCAIQAYSLFNMKICGIQFHPERTKDVYVDILHNDLKTIESGEKKRKTEFLMKITSRLRLSKTDTILKNFLKMI